MQNDLYVVGIGASAGGLEAIEDFFSQVPRYSNLAYVIIQHLSPYYKSFMPEILAKKNNVPIHTATDGMLVEANNIYLIPRNMNMEIRHGKLKLTLRGDQHTLNLPIDLFFTSLASDFRDKSIAIILSGTGSDGSRGIREIKEAGGMIIVQEPETAKFDGMPRNAILTGVCDFILPPKDMPAKLVNYIQHPFVDKKSEDLIIFDDSDNHLSHIIHLLKVKFDLDFSEYKPATIVRRLERRLHINQIKKLSDYFNLLKDSAVEQRILYKELLIGVTKFFRDPEAFNYVAEEVVPQIFKNKQPKETIRVWLAGCSTGEEVYSIAILFKEYCKKYNLINEIKIFATDVDKTAIEYASYGVFNASISADIAPHLLNYYFEKAGDSFKINNNIREMVVFATHNVFKDPPFNKIDLVVCRNLLIYFQPTLQEKTLSLFHFALNTGGYLFLGSSETVGSLENMFERNSSHWKIFQSKGEKRVLTNTVLSTSQLKTLQNSISSRPYHNNKNKLSISDQFNSKLLEDNVPDTVILNSDFDVINSFGEVKRYINLPVTKMLNEHLNMNIKDMVPSEQRLIFNIALNQVLKTNDKVIYNDVKYLCSDGKIRVLTLIFSSLYITNVNNKFIFIYFLEKEANTRSEQKVFSPDGSITEQSAQHIVDLENQLSHTKENLQATIEELETTNEELQTTNEELISSNEELQSTNEELQSVNEELYTVNTEFQIKNKELTIANNDLENLFNSAENNIIFLDQNLCIRKFTPTITDIIHLKENDEGRPLSDLTVDIKDIDLTAVASQSLEKQKMIAMRVNSKNGLWYQMRIVPYRAKNNIINGVIVTFTDITEDYQNEQKTVRTYQYIKDIYNGLPISLCVLDRNQKGEYVLSSTNRKHDEDKGYNSEEVKGKTLSELVPEYLTSEEVNLLKKKITLCVEKKGNVSYRKNINDYFFQIKTLSPVLDDDKNEVVRIIFSNIDIDEKRNFEALEQPSQDRIRQNITLENVLNSSHNSTIIIDVSGTVIYCNNAFINMFNYTNISYIRGGKVAELFANSPIEPFTNAVEIIKHDQPKTGFFEVQYEDKLPLKIFASSSIIKDNDKTKMGIIASFTQYNC